MGYPAARCSLPSICLASTRLKKCLHLTLSPYSLSHHNIRGRGRGDRGRAEWTGWNRRKGKERMVGRTEEGMRMWEGTRKRQIIAQSY